jgi:transcription initiation factor TFIIIB Brf1 subunit/transcription initiation factor TFIIB
VSTLQIQLDSAKRVQLELEESKQKYDKLKQEMERREISANEVLGRCKSNYTFFHKIVETMKQMLQDAVGRVNDDNLIDRRVLARLLFTIADNKSKRILDLIAGMLRANEEEKSILLRLLVGETKQTRSSWFGGGTPAPSTQLPQKSNAHSSSLSKMWVAFLMEVSVLIVN